MATVTKVTQQRRAGRYNIYLDDDYAFAVDEKILITYDLFKGTELDDAAIAEIKAAEFNQKAYTQALTYATGRMRTSHQVVQKLKDKGYERDVIQDVVQRLINDHVVNDESYAQTFVEQAKTTGKLGPKGVQFKLHEAGIDKFVIEDALVDYDKDSQIAVLATRVPKLLDKNSRYSKFMAEQKTQQKLMQQGFDSNLIKQAIQTSRLEEETDDDLEWENLDRDATIVADRYDRYTGWAFTQKFKAAMYRKGYDLNLVDKWLRQHN